MIRGKAYITGPGGSDVLNMTRMIGFKITGVPSEFKDLDVNELANGIGECITSMNELLIAWRERESKAATEAVPPVAEEAAPSGLGSVSATGSTVGTEQAG